MNALRCATADREQTLARTAVAATDDVCAHVFLPTMTGSGWTIAGSSDDRGCGGLARPLSLLPMPYARDMRLAAAAAVAQNDC